MSNNSSYQTKIRIYKKRLEADIEKLKKKLKQPQMQQKYDPESGSWYGKQKTLNEKLIRLQDLYTRCFEPEKALRELVDKYELEDEKNKSALF